VNHPRRARSFLADGALALVLTVLGVGGTHGVSVYRDAGAPVPAWGYGLVVVAALSLLVRRRWPLVTLAVVTVATSVYLVAGYPYGPVLLSLLIAMYTVARYRPVRTTVIAGGLAAALLVLHVIAGHGFGPGLFGVVPASAWVVVPLAVGVTRRLHTESVARTQAEWARRHADDERLRVAQEVHDVVGHGLSSIAMQAEIALHLLTRQPEHAVVALTAISRTSRDALDELRVTLAGVRGEPGDDARAPLPGLARLDALVARMSDSGVAVTVEPTGERRPLPGPVDLAVYRVIQESLTNVLRHAGPAAVTVGLGFTATEVVVEVVDTGRGGGPVSEGQGMAGMRQRVEALGGSFEAGPAPTGFRVRAGMPTW
jgi:signal transduction histidine kinase